MATMEKDAPPAAAADGDITLLPTPTQNQLYGVFMHACGTWRVKRPHRHFLALLEDFESKPKALPTTANDDVASSSSSSAVAAVSAPSPSSNQEQLVPLAKTSAAGVVVDEIPLAQRKVIPMGPKEGPLQQHFGNTSLMVLLDLMDYLPHLTCVDWSVCRLYDVDSYKLGVSGNDVLKALFKWASTHPNVTSIRIPHCPIGTNIAHAIHDCVEANGNITEIVFDDRGVEAFVLKHLNRAIERNQQGLNTANRRPNPQIMADRIQRTMNEMCDIDRKTSDARQQLHLVLWDNEKAFDAILHPTTVAPSTAAAEENTAERKEGQDVSSSSSAHAALVLRAAKCSTAECANASRGLRADDENLYLVASGELHATVGAQKIVLRRGDYFGETLESVMFSGGSITVGERGHVFQIPHSVCKPLFAAWESKVAEILPLLRKSPMLQALPLWLLIRLCHEAEIGVAEADALILPFQSKLSGLWMILSGKFETRLPKAFKKTQRKARGMGIDMAHGSDFQPVEFTALDVCGEEPAVVRHEATTVDLHAAVETRFVKISAAHAERHVVPLLRTAFAIQAKTYSLEM